MNFADYVRREGADDALAEVAALLVLSDDEGSVILHPRSKVDVTIRFPDGKCL